MGDSAIDTVSLRVTFMLFRSDRGATSAEYAILAAGIAAVIVVAVTALGGQTLALFQPVTDFFTNR
jgi:Flp pilus assembly pilin Flp